MKVSRISKVLLYYMMHILYIVIVVYLKIFEHEVGNKEIPLSELLTRFSCLGYITSNLQMKKIAECVPFFQCFVKYTIYPNIVSLIRYTIHIV